MTLLSNLTNWWSDKQSSASLHQLPDSDLHSHLSDTLKDQALTILINRHGDALFHFLVTLSDSELAADISQQLWLKLIERPEHYVPGKSQFRTWLFTAGRNATIDELRKRQRWNWQPIEEELDNTESWQSNDNFISTPSIHEEFDKTLMTLPFAQREALTLQLEGFSIQDIANITFENSETIKSRLRFARKHLKTHLEVSYD